MKKKSQIWFSLILNHHTTYHSIKTSAYLWKNHPWCDMVQYMWRDYPIRINKKVIWAKLQFSRFCVCNNFERWWLLKKWETKYWMVYYRTWFILDDLGAGGIFRTSKRLTETASLWRWQLLMTCHPPYLKSCQPPPPLWLQSASVLRGFESCWASWCKFASPGHLALEHLAEEFPELQGHTSNPQ